MIPSRCLWNVAVVAGCAHPVAPACPADVVLAGQDDVARFAGCAGARSLVIRSGAPLDVSALRGLAAVAGDVAIGPSVGIEEVALGELRTIGGTLHVANNGSLRGLYLPKLERAGRIEIDGNVSLVTVSLPRLAGVDGAVAITDNADLEIVDAGELEAIGGALVIAGHPQLTLVELPKLERAASVRIEGSPKLGADVVEQLAKRATP